MRRAAIACVVALLAIPAAHAEDFDTAAQAATRVRLADVVWALTASCADGDDVQQRQCRHVRDRQVEALAGATLLVDGDRGALEVGAWNPQRKSTPVAISACIRCAGLELDGATWYVIGADAPPRVDRGAVRASRLVETARTFSDAAAAAAWAQAVRDARVEYLVQVPALAKRRWRAGGKQGVALDVVGYRVATPCDGVVIAARPPSAKAPADPQACARPAR